MIPLTPILKQLHPDIAVYMSMGKHWTKKMLSLHHPGPWYLKGSLRDGFGYEMGKISKELDEMDLDWNREEFISYLQPFLIKIDELTPLKYGNNERGNQGDEDN